MIDALAYYNRTRCAHIKIFALARNKACMTSRFSHVPNITFIEQDITTQLDPNLSFDYILHSASPADPIAYATNPCQTIQTNVIGTTTVLEHALKHPGTRVVFYSTMEVYGSGITNVRFREDDYGLIDYSQVRSGYPESKRTAGNRKRDHQIHSNHSGFHAHKCSGAGKNRNTGTAGTKQTTAP